jgi:hypothetical protein
MLMMISYNLDGEEDVDERLLADDETGDVADDVGNEEDRSLLFFFTMGQHPPAEQVGLAPNRCYLFLGAELFLAFFFYSFGFFFGFRASSIFPWFSSIFPRFSSMFP